MKFSLITPEHSPENVVFLLELFDSIKKQTYEDWEWILFLNNKCILENIPEVIRCHEKVNIFRTDEATSSIGAIKKMAFESGCGDVLVEVDHDDILLPECLSELSKAYQDQEVGFVYSDSAVYHMNDEFVPYRSDHGWTFERFDFRGKSLYVMNSFEPSSHALSYIWYAPDHVRSWRKSVYDAIGGHSAELDICDDHELCIRTYLSTKMKHISKPLYIYRINGNNTWLHRAENIQTKTVDLFKTYARSLAEKDAEIHGLLCVDIGGGLNPYPGYVTIDLREGADFQHDLNEGIPLPNNSVGVLNASHILEHLHDKKKIMSEIHRVLAHGGWAFIEVPSTDGRGAFQDPTHVSYWNENSFLYYTDAYLANFIDNKNIRFQSFRLETWFPNEWLQRLNVPVTTAWLVAIKEGGQRLPGLLKI